tara:strand:+ start:49 stop:234 length:186 start_codon:yes stop_codon:yes gene_type:complete
VLSGLSAKITNTPRRSIVNVGINKLRKIARPALLIIINSLFLDILTKNVNDVRRVITGISG